METDYQQDKQSHIDRAAVSGILAVCLDALNVHRFNLGAKLHN
jgi:hypothetical protein